MLDTSVGVSSERDDERANAEAGVPDALVAELPRRRAAMNEVLGARERQKEILAVAAKTAV